MSFTKTNPNLRTIPTAILTASVEDADIETSYSLQANCYLKKPLDLLEFQTVVRAINQFWMSMVTLPKQR